MNLREALELYFEDEPVPERQEAPIVPLHEELKAGTLRSILRWADTTAEHLSKLL